MWNPHDFNTSPIHSAEPTAGEVALSAKSTSLNFEFLREDWSALHAAACLAEQYACSDPASCLVKLRLFTEILVKQLYDRHKLETPYQPKLHDLMTGSAFISAVPEVIRLKLDALRKEGNKAAHGQTTNPKQGVWKLREAWDIARWVGVRYSNVDKDVFGVFKDPQPEADPTELKAEKDKLQKELDSKAALAEELIEKLAKAQEEAEGNKATADQLEQILQQSQQTASALDFTEAETRRHIIDAELIDAGFDIGDWDANRGCGADTSQVKQEVEVDGQPTPSGTGRCDYVIFSADGSPIAVIEAKKAARESKAGLEQAKLYANALEVQYGQRPLIYTSNGFEIHLWDDVAQQPPRRVFGFHAADAMEYKISQRTNKKPVQEVQSNTQIAGRPYQLISIRSVLERFATQASRRALVVQATGTGKTRVAVSLADAMLNHGWAQRILFLCDRNELRRQAFDAFKEFLPNTPRVIIRRGTSQERQHQIYLATYPAMDKVYESFDIGFFDLIIADESHRSIYNRYRPMFNYFDSYQVGLTATPRDIITHDTYGFFGCENEEPTAYFGYEEAVSNNPPYLVPFKVTSIKYGFIDRGLKYSEMTPEQRAELEAQCEEPDTVDYASNKVDQQVFNKDTNRRILSNLMENGIRVADGSHIGKSILFARNHQHAVLLEDLFNEMYPQYGGEFARVIDNYAERVETLIDNFKNPNHPLHLAISVDMLDTGVDVPEVVNLVFAKPLRSLVKFWQMIGRGTRLCPNLFGEGKDKTHFQIFDHWGNFEFLLGDDAPEEKPASQSKSLLQLVFEARIDLAQASLAEQKPAGFELATKLILEDVNDLPDRSQPIKEAWQDVHAVRQQGVIHGFSAATQSRLRQNLAPLMRWRDLKAQTDAARFDLLLTLAQVHFIKQAARYNDYADMIVNEVVLLPINLAQVVAKLPLIEQVKTPSFWDNATIEDLEKVRRELRGIMHLKQKPTGPPRGSAPVFDIQEDESLIESAEIEVSHTPAPALFRARILDVLNRIADQSPEIAKIRSGQRLTEEEITSLNSLILTQDPSLDLNHLAEYYPDTAEHLDIALRYLVGLESEAVAKHLDGFSKAHPNLSATQHRFLQILKNHIAKEGGIHADALFESPFTQLDASGLDGVFDEDDADALFKTITPFLKPKAEGPQS